MRLTFPMVSRITLTLLTATTDLQLASQHAVFAYISPGRVYFGLTSDLEFFG